MYPQPGRRALIAVALALSVLVSCRSPTGTAVADLPRVDWRTLTDLDVATGASSDDLDALMGPQVKIPGFVVPFEDSFTEVKTFVLVPSFGSCIHRPPPGANQMVLVEMAEGQTAKVDLLSREPIWVAGTLSIQETDSPWGAVGFSMTGLRTVRFADGLGEGGVW